MAELRPYTVQPIRQDETKKVIAFLTRTFYVDEPLNRAVGLCDESKEQPALEKYCTKALEAGHSFKAIDKDGNIIGCVINDIEFINRPEDGNNSLSLAESCKDKKFQKILYIIAARGGANLWERFPHEKKALEIKIASTDPTWRRHGIMNVLVAETEKKAKELGINLLQMDTSSEYSAKSAVKNGFTCVYEADYKDIKWNGQTLVVPEAPHTTDRVFVKLIS